VLTTTALLDDPSGWAENGRNPYRTHFSVGGICLRVAGDHSVDVSLVPSLLPFRSDPGKSDIQIRVERVPNLQPTRRNRVFDSQSVWSLYQGEADFQFDFGTPILRVNPYKRLLVDTHFHQARLLLVDESSGQEPVRAPLEYPLDEVLITHRLARDNAIQLHGVGVVGPHCRNNLFVGHSGAGKSTTARLWTSLHEVKILSDDRIIVRESPLRDLRPGDDPRQIFMYGTPWHGEACFALPDRAQLHRIFILEHGRGNVLTRLTKSQAVGELFVRSFVPFHRHGYIEAALSFLEQLAESVPCYRYCFEPDTRAVEKILQFHD
jgi:hypothetical protein